MSNALPSHCKWVSFSWCNRSGTTSQILWPRRVSWVHLNSSFIFCGMFFWANARSQINLLSKCRALGSMAMFPILQWVFRNDVSKREGIPQLAYGVEGTVHTHRKRERERSSSTVPMWKYLINKLVALITSLLGVRSHFRFKRIIALSHRNNGASNKAIVTRLAYFKDMNVLISIILFFYAASFIVLCSDGLTDHKIINSNKFATDTIIANVNICTVFLWLLLVR